MAPGRFGLHEADGQGRMGCGKVAPCSNPQTGRVPHPTRRSASKWGYIHGWLSQHSALQGWRSMYLASCFDDILWFASLLVPAGP